MAKHILIVEDSSGVRKPVMRRIGQAGTDAGSDQAREGSDRTRAFESRTFDLILADVVEPGMGHGATGRLKTPFTPETIQSTIGPFLK